jgi:hypothetical protein
VQHPTGGTGGRIGTANGPAGARESLGCLRSAPGSRGAHSRNLDPEGHLSADDQRQVPSPKHSLLILTFHIKRTPQILFHLQREAWPVMRVRWTGAGAEEKSP